MKILTDLKMRVAVVSGDGLLESGLLTVLRNVLSIAKDMSMIEDIVPCDLGTSWRPDKAAFFSEGDPSWMYPDWMTVTPNRQLIGLDLNLLAKQLMTIRSCIASLDDSDQGEVSELETLICPLATLFEAHFDDWLQIHQPDQVFALNMTLSDAVPATLGLHKACERYFANKAGNVIFWEHDLFDSCSIQEDGNRVYPRKPHILTPVPQQNAYTKWIVVSEQLKQETDSYPTWLQAKILLNALPEIEAGVPARAREFSVQRGFQAGRPIMLNPVRLFPIKGVEHAVRLTGALKTVALQLGRKPPYLLLFGNTREAPEYTQKLRNLIAELELFEDVIFLDGVPLSSAKRQGVWRLDEIDLLRLCRESGGAVVFTPSAPNVESVGLGPALAALASVPSIISSYNAFQTIYGNDFFSLCLDTEKDIPELLARDILTAMEAAHRNDPGMRANLDRNKTLVRERFNPEVWREYWRELFAEFQGRLNQTHWQPTQKELAGSASI